MKGMSHREAINLAVKHYSSLFNLPSLKTLLIMLCLESLLLGALISLLCSPSTSFFKNIFLESIFFGSTLFILTISCDYLVNKTLLRQDIVLGNFRRMIFLSFLSNIFFIISITVNLMFKNWHINAYVKALSLGLFAASALRLLVIDATSFSSRYSRIFSSMLQPALLLLLSKILVAFSSREDLHLSSLLIPLLLALAFSILSVWLFSKSLDREGRKVLGIPSIEIAKAFITNWTEGVKEPFERILSQLSEERDVFISALIFRAKSTGKLKAIIVVPNIHPGPFKNVGSSLLPSMIKEHLKKEFQCIVSVPHGISGHELDLPSHIENEKVIRGIVESLKKCCNFSDRATNFLMIERGGAKVGCQVFNDCIFMTLTISPESMEDLPLEINDAITKKAIDHGFSCSIIVDAHNSTNGPFNMEKSMKALEEAAYLALEKASLLRDGMFSDIKVGAGEAIPKDLGLKEGMGPGGITAVVVEVNGQKTAYVTIDGNNMVSGLREKILSSLREIGIEGGEVFTTDTHAVSAIVSNKRGYYPIGEAIDHERIINEVKKAAQEALKDKEPSEAAWCKINIRGVKVIGEKRISELSLLTDSILRKAKKSSTIFVALGALLIMILMRI